MFTHTLLTHCGFIKTILIDICDLQHDVPIYVGNYGFGKENHTLTRTFQNQARNNTFMDFTHTPYCAKDHNDKLFQSEFLN